MPRNVSASGLAMDVDRVVNNQVDKDNNVQNRINFNQMVGNRLSAMEHLIPEQMFSTPEAQAEGISAVKAIAIASAEGQKIWTITQENVEDALASINLDADTESEIRNSVNAGMVVTAHEQSINFNGWIGEGYIILDPATGAGAYKIAGGGNGGVILIIVGLSMLLLMFVFLFSGFVTVLAPFIAFSALSIISSGVEFLGVALGNETLQSAGCGFKWLFMGFSVLRLLSQIATLAAHLVPAVTDSIGVAIGTLGVFACL